MFSYNIICTSERIGDERDALVIALLGPTYTSHSVYSVLLLSAPMTTINLAFTSRTHTDEVDAELIVRLAPHPA